MIKATLLASFITGLIYLLTGLLGYFMYGDIIEDNLLTYFKTDIQKYLKSNVLISFILLISEIAFFISAMLAMPIVFFALKSNLFNLIRFLFKKIKRKRFNSASYEGINNNFKKTSFLNEKSKFILTGITYFCVLLFAIGVEKIIVIDNIVGSTADNIIYFIAPGFFVLRLGKKYLNKFESFIAKFYIFIGSITIGIFILIQLGIIK
jgi:flagellar biosynthesis protein FlhB